ncbi:hypothetical protein SEA_GIANTSBANE_20 [Arthrobacter phage Giantsbane]|nr:hypothetical protein SEA_GIANTSBANE_20 [Arthrobacter phage Giantsbane]
MARPLSTATLTINSTTVDPEALADLEAILYGTDEVAPRLPYPSEVLSIVNRIGLFVTPDSEPGVFEVAYGSMVEDPEDPGTFLIVKEGVYEDPEEPGTYLIGEPEA